MILYCSAIGHRHLWLSLALEYLLQYSIGYFSINKQIAILCEEIKRVSSNDMLIDLPDCLGLLSSVLNQRPEDLQLEMLVHSKHEHCINRAQALHSKIVHEKEREAAQPDGQTDTQRHVMGELHIDNQIKREAASSDYTPLHNAIHRAPAPLRDPSQRLSRADSQISNDSNSSAGRHYNSAPQRPFSSTASESSNPERTVHVVPPKLQHSISQLQQKLKRQLDLEAQHNAQEQSQQDPPTQHPRHVNAQQYSTAHNLQQNITPQNNTQHILAQNNSQQSGKLSRYQQPAQLPTHAQTGPQLPTRTQQSYHRQSSGGSPYDDIEARSSSSKSSRQSNSMYREVNIPTTLQRMDYIRDGYGNRANSNRADSNRTNSNLVDRKRTSSPGVIPPPKEFQESSSLGAGLGFQDSPTTSIGRENDSDRNRGYQVTSAQQPGTMYGAQAIGGAPVYSSHANGYAPQNPHTVNQPQSTHSQLVSSRSTRPTADETYTREMSNLPPKQNINKQNIRDLLVQDMLKRKGQPGTDLGRPLTNTYGTKAKAAQSPYDTQLDEPLWTPPQRSAYEQGLSHYDRPNHLRQNLYGQVNSQSATSNRHSMHGRSQPSLVSL